MTGKMKKNRFCYHVLSGIAGLLILGSIAFGVRAENGLDWNQKNSIVVHTNEKAKEYIDELKKTEDRTGILVYDLYKVADVEKRGNGFSYKWNEEYAELEQKYDEATKGNLSDSKLDWMQLAQEALIRAVGDEGSLVNASKKAAYSGLPFEEAENIDKGLYLLVARGSLDDKTIVESRPVYSADVSNPEIESYQLVTHSWLDVYTFTVQPLLLCVPTKMSKDSVVAPDTATEGEWIYEQEVTLKMEEDPASGSIRINKELAGYYGDVENTVFVFQVDVYYPTEKELYSSEVYSMTFDHEGKKSLQIDGLPLGAQIKIMEIYSGANFTASIEAPDSLNVVVGNREMEEVTFTNTYNGKKAGGGGVTNHFVYDGEKGWTWEKSADNTITSNGIADDYLLQQVIKMSDQKQEAEE